MHQNWRKTIYAYEIFLWREFKDANYATQKESQCFERILLEPTTKFEKVHEYDNTLHVYVWLIQGLEGYAQAMKKNEAKWGLVIDIL